ncbi:MAG: hypothetical protein GF410_01505, partial [Chitinivibrionales bacterium]|nr:hypothetical protein [Chitinivibrionales bacterium]
MDSSAYLHSIAALQRSVAAASPFVPYELARCAVSVSPRTSGALAAFLDALVPGTDSPQEQGAHAEWALPPALHPDTKGFIAG